MLPGLSRTRLSGQLICRIFVISVLTVPLRGVSGFALVPQQQNTHVPPRFISRSTPSPLSMVMIESIASPQSKDANDDDISKANEIADSNDSDETERRDDQDATADDDEVSAQASAGDGDDDDDDEIVKQRKRQLFQAGLLGQTRGRRKPNQRDTSVGARRRGSASRAGATSRIVETLRQSSTRKKKEDSSNETKASSLAKPSQVQTAIEGMIRQRRKEQPLRTAAFSAFHHHKLFTGLTDMEESPDWNSDSIAGEVLATGPGIVVRLATPADDVAIATLRLSVFSDFSPEQQSHFCARSCQALSNRRQRGASCFVAVDDETSSVWGTVECSYHEFFCTSLGARRRQFSIWYVTEVAVQPAARRRGIGRLLLQGIEVYAREHGVETLYLHVDVTNEAALGLYEQAGFAKITDADPMFLQFTTSLNLQPGATKGRDHFLLSKDLVSDPTWLAPDIAESRAKVVSNEQGVLGFHVPA